MRLGTKFSLTTVLIVVVFSFLLEVTSVFVFSRKIHALNQELFVHKLEDFVQLAYEQDELFFEGVYKDLKEGQWRLLNKIDILYRNKRDAVTFPFIVDTGGRIVVHPAESRWKKAFRHSWEKGDLMFDENIQAFMLRLKEGEFEYVDPREGIKRWVVFKTYEPWNWVFCMTTSKELLDKATYSFIKFALVISILVIVLSILVSLWLSRHYTRPIHAVIDRLRQIARGEAARASRIPVNAQADDEVGLLARAVNKMAEDLEKTTVSRDSLLKEIEERKRLESMMLQSEKMAAVGQLAGGVAHEINNPLGVILGFAQGIVKRLEPGNPFEMPLRSIEREAVRCKQLVQDLLTFSRTGSTLKEPMDMNEAMEGAFSLVLAQSKVKNVEFVKELDSSLPPITAHKGQIQQIVVNLCNNAIDAMSSEGGKLFVRTRKAFLNEKPAVEIQVEDTGPGIPLEIRTKIFEPFFTTKEVGKGTGLGLSLVYEIVQKHQGHIAVRSGQGGKGTIFSVVIPVR